jgi:hypothetical protein
MARAPKSEKSLTPSALDAAKEELELEQARLAIAKTKLEIKELSQSWWRRITVSAPFATIFVAIVGFVSVWQTGYFDQKKALLEADVAALTKTKAELEKVRAGLDAIIEENGVIFKDSLVRYLSIAHLDVLSYIFIPFDPTDYCNVGPAKNEGNILAGAPFHSSGFEFSAYFFRHVELSKTGMSVSASDKFDTILQTLASDFSAGSSKTFQQLMTKYKIEEFDSPFSDLEGPMELDARSSKILCDPDPTAKFSASEIGNAKEKFAKFSSARSTFSFVVEWTYKILAAEVSLTSPRDLIWRPDR